MPYAIGVVESNTPEGGLRFRLEDGQSIVIESTDLAKVSDLAPGDRAMLNISDGLVRSIVRMPASALEPESYASSTTPSQEIRAGDQPAAPTTVAQTSFVATIEEVDRAAGQLTLQTTRGRGIFRPAGLSAEYWERLAPGRVVRLQRDDLGKFQMTLASTGEAPGSGDGSKSALPAPLDSSRSGVGIVEAVAATGAWVADGATPETTSSTLRLFCPAERLPDAELRPGDRVAYRASNTDNQIIDLTLLEHQAIGIGGRDPNADLIDEIASRTKRSALAELAQHFWREKQLAWYWLTPERKPTWAPDPGQIAPEVFSAVRAAQPGFGSLYSHQAQALEALAAGRNVLVLTPTASGKTLCYNPAVLDALIADPSATAIYVFPLNALLDDQCAKLEDLLAELSATSPAPSIVRLVGGLGTARLREIGANPPRIIATNPEMLSWLLGGSSIGQWSRFLGRLRFVVLDEVHTYRGLLGLHMAGLVRRLSIACARNRNPAPQFVLSSATVGSPRELATRLTALPLASFTVLGESADGSAQPPRHWLMLSPAPEEQRATRPPFGALDGPAERPDQADQTHSEHLHAAAKALVDVLTVPREDLTAIVFARSVYDVKFIERLARELLRDRARGDLANRIQRFASRILTTDQKREIYDDLRDGRLRAVVSSNALEAGIDIGRLDVCIIVGFPFHVMRLRQMAGRAGRRAEGAVIYLPNTSQILDRFYFAQPDRLLTAPPESFVIDVDNPYIARKHIAACIASLPGGARLDELSRFGPVLGSVLAEGTKAEVLGRQGEQYTASRRQDTHDPWAIGNIRATEQEPYAICNATPEQRVSCAGARCPMTFKNASGQQTCSHLVQIVDRQYVYLEAHPGAVFEDSEGELHEIRAFSEAERVARAVPAPRGTTRRTHAAESTEVRVVEERGRRAMPGGATLAWGSAIISREYSGYFEYQLIEHRRCPSCHAEHALSQRACPKCRVRLRTSFESTPSKFQEYPEPYQATTYRIDLNTIACWLTVPTELEARLSPLSECKLAGPENRVGKLLKSQSAYGSVAEVAARFRLERPTAQAVFGYIDQHRHVFDAKPRDQSPTERKQEAAPTQPVYPVHYGQCLRRHLDNEDAARGLTADHSTAVFARVTGYPADTDPDHVCRSCVTSQLPRAAHTLEHLIARGYPMVALGDSQDLGSTTDLLHPQTGTTTVFWYDAFDGGIGAAEKIFGQFDALLARGLQSLDCDCSSDAGCPFCIQTPTCDRQNESIGKVAGRGLVQILLGLADYLPDRPIYWSAAEHARQTRQQREPKHAREAKRPSGGVSAAGGPQAAGDPLDLLRVQPHVHDTVLRRALEIRGEEIGAELPPVSLAELQQAYREVLGRRRPASWQFPPSWSCFEILHIRPEASERLAHAAYKLVVRGVHPDVNAERVAWATEATKRVNAAWDAIQRIRKR